MVIGRDHGARLGCDAVASRPAVLVTDAKTESGGKPPHEIRAIELLWIEQRGRGSISGDERTFDEGRGVSPIYADRRKTHRGTERRPFGDALDAYVSRGTRRTKEVEQALFLRAIASLPAQGDAEIAATQRSLGRASKVYKSRPRSTSVVRATSISA